MKARLFLFTGQVLDAASFALFFAAVPAVILSRLEVAERNPVLATLMAIGGFMAVVFVKIGAVSLVIWRDQKRPNRPKKTAFVMGIAAISGYVGASFNLMALYTVMAVTS
jgi:hypothetical protein